MEELIDRFDAASDDGDLFTVEVYQTVRTTRLLNGESRVTRGMKRLALSDGRDLNWIDAQTFKIVVTDEIIRKV